MFISYAQNFEDLILRRLFTNVKKGFYIDVGAYDPEIDSVTKAFYDMGWSGINIEPIPSLYERFVEKRPRDINLQIVANDSDGIIKINEILNTGLSTVIEKIATRHVKDGGFKRVRIEVKAKTLTSICSDLNIENIHFLKIDVEGSEKKVLDGFDLNRFRPWVILIEATEPLSQNLNHEKWEFLLLNSAYVYAYFDGLNRFYVSKEHENLKQYFITPPNIFDEVALTEAHHFNKTLYTKYQHLSLELSKNTAELHEVHQSNHSNWIDAEEQKARASGYLVELEGLKESLISQETLHQQKILENQSLIQQTIELMQKSQLQAEISEARASGYLVQLEHTLAELHEVHQSNHRNWVLAEEQKARANGYLVELEHTLAELHEVHQSNHSNWVLARDREEQIEAFYASRSWRITAPFRWLKCYIFLFSPKNLLVSIDAWLNRCFRKIDLHFMSKPLSRKKFINLSKKLNLYSLLILIRNRYHPQNKVHELQLEEGLSRMLSINSRYLTPEAARIYKDLQKALLKYDYRGS
jgi:FkbM family methyltransferase